MKKILYGILLLGVFLLGAAGCIYDPYYPYYDGYERGYHYHYDHPYRYGPYGGYHAPGYRDRDDWR